MGVVDRVAGLPRLPLRVAVVALAGLLPLAAPAQNLFKCGATYQDRPCESRDVQQRYSRAAGTFNIDQVNPDTDKDCAGAVAQIMPYWNRLAKGETLESIRSEIDQQRISRYEKSQMRDLLIALREFKGTQMQVRSQFETQCMAYKKRNGYPTERELAEGRGSSYDGAKRAADARVRRAEAEASRAEWDARRAEADARRAEYENRMATQRAR